MEWTTLTPEKAMLDALDAADSSGARSDVINTTRSQAKTGWSNRFADASARMVADILRVHKETKRLTVLPVPEGSAEQPTQVVGGTTKKIDVIAGSLTGGLQIGISLKGLNFRDRTSLNFGHNMTGRTYELMDEVRAVHEFQPYAFMVAVYFLPVGSANDKKTDQTPSTFGRVVEHLRTRTGRLDPLYAPHLSRPDLSLVALYAPGDAENFTKKETKEWEGPNRYFSYADEVARGVVRFFDVADEPPRRGLPSIESTFTLAEAIDHVVERWQGQSGGNPVDWADRSAGEPGRFSITFED